MAVQNRKTPVVADRGLSEDVCGAADTPKATLESHSYQGAWPTASRAAVFETWWACPFCAENAYFEVDLHPATFAALGCARKTPARTCAAPRCRQFIPRDLNHEPIDALVNDVVRGWA